MSYSAQYIAQSNSKDWFFGKAAKPQGTAPTARKIEHENNIKLIPVLKFIFPCPPGANRAEEEVG